MALQNVSDRLIGQEVTQIGQCSDDAIISPARILTRHSHHQSFHVRLNGGAAWILSVFRTIGLLGDGPSIPGQDGVGVGHAGHLSERFASHTPPDLGAAPINARPLVRIGSVIAAGGYLKLGLGRGINDILCTLHATNYDDSGD